MTMAVKRLQILLIVVQAFCSVLQAQSNSKELIKLTGPYLGQTPPGMTPEIFAEGIISTGCPEICISFTPDGKEVYYTMGGLPHSVILVMKEVNNFWTSPRVASFSGKYSAECQLSPDGNTMYFCSGIPDSGSGDPKGNWDIWAVEKSNVEWGDAVRVPAPLASDEYSADCPSVASNRNLYFYSANYPGGMGKGDIYVSKFIDGNYSEPENLGTTINTEHYDMDPFIAPDESYIIFSSNRPDGIGMNDLYLSFKKGSGTWSEAINIGEAINSTAHEIHPFVTVDKKYLFFCSTRRVDYKRYSDSSITYDEKIRWLNKPGNGAEDIYWVDAKIIYDLQSKVLMEDNQ